jgi:hypothetical protein
MPFHDFDSLEQRLHRGLRQLPAREAPRTLEARVLAELARCGALPWWRRSYAHWPVGVRYAFIVILAAAAAGVLLFSRSAVTAEAVSSLATHFPWIAFLQSLVASLRDTASAIFDAVPNAWLYGAGAVLALCYAALFGLGTALYRVFYRPRLFRSFSP